MSESKPETRDEKFGSSPFGYSLGAYTTWIQILDNKGIEHPYKLDEIDKYSLKNTVLWSSQASALGQAGISLIKENPDLSGVPNDTKELYLRQYCGVGLMLVGYSMELTLKTIILVKEGKEKYIDEHEHKVGHNLNKLEDYILDLTKKQKNILNILKFYVKWAGRYPDPGTGKESQLHEINNLCDKYEITAGDLFTLCQKISEFLNHVIQKKIDGELL